MPRTGPPRHPATTLATALAALSLVAGCGSPSRHATTPSTPASTAPTAPATGDHGGGGGSHGQSGGGRAPAPSLPADWPTDVPVPPGQLQGTTAGAGRWSALLLVNSTAADTMTASARVYTDAGFIAVSDSVFRKGRHLVTIGVENRDHSATQTTLVVAIQPLP